MARGCQHEMNILMALADRADATNPVGLNVTKAAVLGTRFSDRLAANQHRDGSI